MDKIVSVEHGGSDWWIVRVAGQILAYVKGWETAERVAEAFRAEPPRAGT